MDINLSELRKQWPKNPILSRIVHVSMRIRRGGLVTLVWCIKKMGTERSVSLFNELVLGFRMLELAGLGRLFQISRRARARFQWAVSPQAVEPAVNDPHALIRESDLLPAAAALGLRLPPPPVEAPERPGWTRHLLTLRPHAAAELLVPDDLTKREAEWLGDFLVRLGDGGKDAATPPDGTSSGRP